MAKPFEELFSQHIWGVNWDQEIYLQEAAGGLEVTLDGGGKEATMLLDPRGVRTLRLALARYERQQEKEM